MNLTLSTISPHPPHPQPLSSHVSPSSHALSAFPLSSPSSGLSFLLPPLRCPHGTSSQSTSPPAPRTEFNKCFPALPHRATLMRNVQCFLTTHGQTALLLKVRINLPAHLQASAHPLALTSWVLPTTISYKTPPVSHPRPSRTLWPDASSHSRAPSVTWKPSYSI